MLRYIKNIGIRLKINGVNNVFCIEKYGILEDRVPWTWRQWPIGGGLSRRA